MNPKKKAVNPKRIAVNPKRIAVNPKRIAISQKRTAMYPKNVQNLFLQFNQQVKALEDTIKQLNIALGAPVAKQRTTITFQSNPAKKIEDTSTLITMDGGINEIM